MSEPRSIRAGLDYAKWTGDFDPDDLLAQIEAAYKAKARPAGFVQKTSFAPSALGYGSGKCPRRWVLAFNGADIEDEIDPRGMANMMQGSAIHERLQSLLEESGKVVEIERKIKTEDPPVGGFIDVIMDYGKHVPIEIKSTSQASFDQRRMTRQPPEYHLIQLLLYMWAEGVDEGAFLYENKDTQELLVLPVKLNEKNKAITEKMLDWMRQVYKAYEAGDSIKRPHRSKTTQICSSCPFRDPCWEGEDGTLVLKDLKL